MCETLTAAKVRWAASSLLLSVIEKTGSGAVNMGSFNRRLMMTLMGGVAMMGISPAMAQADGAQSPPDDTGGLTEIVVTAQKRKENAQKVGIAITAFSADAIRQLGVTEPKDLAQFTPSLNVKNVLNKSAPVFTIRGIGNAAFTSNSVSPVGVYVDELFLPSSTMMSFSVFDTERVEVLKGPQGTLFGRNTTAGAVSFTTKAPRPGETDGYARVGFGNYNTIELETAATATLNEDTAVRLAGKWTKQGQGTFTNRINNTSQDIGRGDTLALRASLVTKVDNLDIYLNVHGGRDRSQNEPWVGIGRAALDNPSGAAPELPGVNGMQYRNLCHPLATTSIWTFIRDPNCVNRVGYHDPYENPRVGEFSGSPIVKSDSFGALARLSLDLDWASLTSITAMENLDKTTSEDFDGGPYRIGDTSYRNQIGVFSQELRLTSAEPLGGRVNWILGGLYYRDRQHVTDLYGYRDRVNHDVLVDFVQKTESIAGYLHTETRIVDGLKLIGGIRLTHDRTSFDGGTTVVNKDSDFTGAVTFFSVDSPILTDSAIASTEVTGKVGLDYQVTPDVLLYASYSHGYKAGVWNGTWATVPGEHSGTKPEFIDAYEAGFKSELIDRHLRLNGAVYHYDYTDMQLFTDLPDGRYTVFNAGRAKIDGAELELTGLIGDHFELHGGAGYTDAKVSAAVAGLDFSGVRPANTPKWTFNTVARYSNNLSDSLKYHLQASYSWQDKVYFSLDNYKASSQDAYGLLDLRAGLDSDKGWSLEAWVKNATNKTYFTEILSSGSASLISGQIGAPRTYGASLSITF